MIPFPACGLGNVMSYRFSLQFSFLVLMQIPAYCSQKSAKAGIALYSYPGNHSAICQAVFEIKGC